MDDQTCNTSVFFCHLSLCTMLKPAILASQNNHHYINH